MAVSVPPCLGFGVSDLGFEGAAVVVLVVVVYREVGVGAVSDMCITD